jgi:hypothetical protein
MEKICKKIENLQYLLKNEANFSKNIPTKKLPKPYKYIFF